VITDLSKAPFPWFGGKSKAAPVVWAAMGDVEHYVEPFAGSMAVLLNRPHLANRTYFSETVNDLDGLLVNAWRSIVMHPDATAEAASWPVAEADLIARHLRIVRWREERNLELLMGDPAFCDPQVAGWWLWGICCWIGSGWCSGTGAWTADDNGRIFKQAPAKRGTAGTREPGVRSQLPHLTGNGRGVNRPQLREPGVKGQRPHLGNGGQGVNRPQIREPGVKGERPELGGGGRGVNHPGTREPGVSSQRPHLGDEGRGVNRPGTREPGVDFDDEFHAMTMPELRRWFGWLSARLRHVRILNGDWRRAVTGGASLTLSVRMGDGHAGIFLDPPYADTASRADGLYAVDSLTVAHDVRRWCLDNGDNPKLRIVLAGFDGEHGTGLTDAGWREIEWFRAGFLTGGMGNTGQGDSTHQQARERLWLSPHCLADADPTDTQLDLFGGDQ